MKHRQRSKIILKKLFGDRQDATGYLGQAETRGMAFTKIGTHLIITIDDEENRKSAEKCVDLTKKYCLITNSIKSETTLTFDISVV